MFKRVASVITLVSLVLGFLLLPAPPVFASDIPEIVITDLTTSTTVTANPATFVHGHQYRFMEHLTGDVLVDYINLAASIRSNQFASYPWSSITWTTINGSGTIGHTTTGCTQYKPMNCWWQGNGEFDYLKQLYVDATFGSPGEETQDHAGGNLMKVSGTNYVPTNRNYDDNGDPKITITQSWDNTVICNEVYGEDKTECDPLFNLNGSNHVYKFELTERNGLHFKIGTIQIFQQPHDSGGSGNWVKVGTVVHYAGTAPTCSWDSTHMRYTCQASDGNDVISDMAVTAYQTATGGEGPAEVTMTRTDSGSKSLFWYMSTCCP